MPRHLTNYTDLPLPIYQAIKNDSYVPRGDISVTTLIDSPYIRLLRKFNEYEEDASDMVWALMGQALHCVIERAGDKIDNSKFYPEIKMELKIEDRLLSGTSDLIERVYDENGVNIKNILHDYKNIFVWSAMAGEDSPSYDHWKKQTNIYRLMAKYGRHSDTKEKIGIEIHEIYIHAFLRDWKKSESKRMSNYPPKAVMTFKIELLDEKYIVQYLKDRKTSHFLSEDAMSKGFDIPVCNEEERWARPEIWKIMNADKKRSLKNFTINSDQDRNEANVYLALKMGDYNGKLWIQKEPGVDTRCADYCSVCGFCKYYRANYDSYGQRKKGDVGAGQNENVSGQIEEPVIQESKIKFDFD